MQTRTSHVHENGSRHGPSRLADALDDPIAEPNSDQRIVPSQIGVIRYSVVRPSDELPVATVVDGRVAGILCA
jgi:hypothetical protein